MTNNFEMPKMSTVENELRAEIERLTKERNEARGMLEADRDFDHERALDEWAYLGSGGFDPPIKKLFTWEEKTDE